MLTVLLFVVLALVTVAASEFVRSECRRMLRHPVTPPRVTAQPSSALFD